MKGSTAARKGLKRGDQVVSIQLMFESVLSISNMIRSWTWTGRASNMWWPWSGLLKSSPNRHYSRWPIRQTNRHVPGKPVLSTSFMSFMFCRKTLAHLYALCQVNVKSNFLAFKEANNLSSDRKKEQEQGESSNSLSPAMANMSLQPGLPVAG